MNGGRMLGGRGRGVRGTNRYGNRGTPRNRQIITRMVDGRRIHNGNYSPDKYRRLAPAQREAVRDMHRQAHSSNGRRNEPNRNGRNLNVSAVGYQDESGGTTGTQPDDDHRAPPSSESAVRFAQTGSVGNYPGNRRSHQAPSDHQSSE